MIRNLFIAVQIIGSLCFSQNADNRQFISEIDSSLAKLVSLQKDAAFIHPALKEFYPIAIVRSDSLYIFDYDQMLRKYNFVKRTLVPFPMSEEIQASFPLSVYENLPTCVVGRQIFSSLDGYSTIMHEFVHCWQYNLVELSLKAELEIARRAAANNDYSWEIMHPFPYSDSLFVMYYDNFIEALQKNEIDKSKNYRSMLKNYLSKIDFEYLVWEEWKEGLARYVENKVRQHFGIKQNIYGKDKPFNRVVFYYGGALFIFNLILENEKLFDEGRLLFETMNEY